jgi:hypothetical protein
MVEQDAFLELVSPVAPAPQTGDPGACRRPVKPWSGFGDVRVSIVENGKANAWELLEGVRASLILGHGALRGVTVHKEVSGPLREGALAELVAGSDLVLVGSAD